MNDVPSQTAPPQSAFADDYVPAFATPSNPESFSARNRGLFRSEQSFRWFTRMHRDRLIRAGALVNISGRWFVHLPSWSAVFSECVAIDTARAGGCSEPTAGK